MWKPAQIWDCLKGCTNFQDIDGINYTFRLSLEDPKMEIIHKYNPLGFNFHLGDYYEYTIVYSILASDIPDHINNNTYDISEYLLSFVPKIEKLKSFL